MTNPLSRPNINPHVMCRTFVGKNVGALQTTYNRKIMGIVVIYVCFQGKKNL